MPVTCPHCGGDISERAEALVTDAFQNGYDVGWDDACERDQSYDPNDREREYREAREVVDVVSEL